MSNTHPTTGVRFGVIACASLDPDLVNDLMYGAGAKDLTYQAAYGEAKKQAEREANELEAEACRDDAESRGYENGELQDAAVEAMWERKGYRDRDDYIEQKLEQFSSCYESNEPTIEGEHEGVKYQVSWLGGAPLLWVMEGPLGMAASLCSPCVPNAADLDSGFTHGTVEDGVYPPTGYECYVVPRDWLASTTPT